MKTKVQTSLVENVKTLKQPKLAFASEAKKRKTKDEDFDERAAKKQKTNRESNDTTNENQETKKKNNVVENISKNEDIQKSTTTEGEANAICEVKNNGQPKFSNSMKDAVKAECKICRYAQYLLFPFYPFFTQFQARGCTYFHARTHQISPQDEYFRVQRKIWKSQDCNYRENIS